MVSPANRPRPQRSAVSRPGGLLRTIDTLVEGRPAESEALADRYVRDGPAEKLRIAFVLTLSDSVGGAFIHVRDLSTELTTRGHDVRVYMGGTGPYDQVLRDLGVHVELVPSLVRRIDLRSDLAAWRDLSRRLADFDPQVVSTHSSKAGVIGRLAARRLRAATMFTAHGWAFTNGVGFTRSAVYSAVELAVAPLADLIVCVSEHDRRLARRRGIHRLTPVVAIPNAVRDIDTSIRADPAAEPVRIIVVARLADPKCQEELIRAMVDLPEATTARFVGDGPRQNELTDLAERLGVAERCEFLGHRSDVAELLADSQIFVLTSSWEGMPRSILEAMRAGLPVVASRTGGIPEIVAHGDTGYIIDSHDVDQLTRRLTALCASPERRRAMGARARSAFEDDYELQRLTRQMIAIYGDLSGPESTAAPERSTDPDTATGHPFSPGGEDDPAGPSGDDRGAQLAERR